MSSNNEGAGTNFNDPTKTLSEDFKSVVSDAAGLIKNTANQGGDVLATARSKVKESLDMAKAKVADTQAVLVDQTKAAAKATDVYVQENPWKSVGIAAGVGLLIGFILGRR